MPSSSLGSSFFTTGSGAFTSCFTSSFFGSSFSTSNSIFSFSEPSLRHCNATL